MIFRKTPPRTVQVEFSCVYTVPEDIAERWLAYYEVDYNPLAQPNALVNAACKAPAGFHPEMTLKAITPPTPTKED